MDRGLQANTKDTPGCHPDDFNDETMPLVTTALCGLPMELLLVIEDFLGSPRDLSSMARVNKTLHAKLQPLLCRKYLSCHETANWAARRGRLDVLQAAVGTAMTWLSYSTRIPGREIGIMSARCTTVGVFRLRQQHFVLPHSMARTTSSDTCSILVPDAESLLPRRASAELGRKASWRTTKSPEPCSPRTV